MELNLGPISIRSFSGNNWSSLELAFVTNRHGGMARRETALRSEFKSEHLIDAVGRENPADSFECPDTGTIFFGKIVELGDGIHMITAKEVYTRALFERAVKKGLADAESATKAVKNKPATA